LLKEKKIIKEDKSCIKE